MVGRDQFHQLRDRSVPRILGTDASAEIEDRSLRVGARFLGGHYHQMRSTPEVEVVVGQGAAGAEIHRLAGGRAGPAVDAEGGAVHGVDLHRQPLIATLVVLHLDGLEAVLVVDLGPTVDQRKEFVADESLRRSRRPALWSLRQESVRFIGEVAAEYRRDQRQRHPEPEGVRASLHGS